MPLMFYCIGLCYLYASPHFESPDSIYHVGVIKWIAETGELPIQSPEHDELYAHEGSQAPLYYLLMTPVWAAFDTSDFDDYLQRNPLVFKGQPARLGNRNFALYRQPHPPDLQGASLALYVIRLITLGMGALTIYAIYRAARILQPSVPVAILAAALAAFNPQVLYISSSVSNDSLVAMLVAFAIWQILVMLRDGFETRRSMLVGLLIALASLTKLSGLAMGLTVAVSSIYIAMRDRDRRGFIILAASMAALWLLIAGWWYLRNLNLYGELFGANALIENFGGRSASLSQVVSDEFQGLRNSFWGLFGWFSIFTGPLHYLAMDLLSLLAAVGLAVYLFFNRRDRVKTSAVLLLSILVAIAGAALLWYTMRTTASQGRLLFAVICAISVLMAAGLSAWRMPPLLLIAPMFVFSVAAPFAYIIPQYDHPPRVTALPDTATVDYARWDDITLVGHELPAPQRWSAGDEIPLTLYWQPLARSRDLQAFFITLLDAEGEAIATIDTFPGWGSLPPTWWLPGAIYRDDYILQIPKDTEAYTTVSLHIGWYDWETGADILPRRENGAEYGAFIRPAGALIAGDVITQLPADARENGAVFGDAIRLNRTRFSRGHLLELEWQILRELSGDWRVFAIVLAEDYQPGQPFEILLQKDASPAVPLDYLAEGESFLTRHAFELPAGYAGEHRIYIGWYNEQAGIRLSAPFPADMLPLNSVRFTAFGAPAN